MSSKLATKLAEQIFAETLGVDFPQFSDIESIIDDSLSRIRESYSPDILARCPIITHHNMEECAFCITAAMKDLISLQ